MAGNDPIRVLHVLGTTNLGGAESRVMELYRCMDRQRVQFDFLIHTDKEGFFSREIRELGGNIYNVPRFKGKNYFEYKRALTDFFSGHNDYAAVHGHMTSTASIYLPIAKRAGVPVTIAHARSAGVDKGIKGVVTRILRRRLKDKADFCFTCSAEAAEAVYGKKAVDNGKIWTVPNAIDAERFSFNENVRNEVREQLGVADKLVVGHVGRFSFMKNHEYLIDIFSKLCRQRSNTCLVLIGEGELKDRIRLKAQEYGIADKVYFLGNRADVERYYQAFDCFVFPSVFEGLPGSVIEAQTAGVPCIVSDKVTGEAKVTDLAVYMSIDLPSEKWADRLSALLEENKPIGQRRRNAYNAKMAVIEKGFDVRTQAGLMAEFYCTGKNPPGHRTVMKGQA